MRQLLSNIVLFLTFILLIAFDVNSSTNSDVSLQSEAGSIEFLISTNGEQQDKNGYTVNFRNHNSNYKKKVSASDTVIIEGLNEGSYDAELTGIAYNCHVNGKKLRSAEIVGGNTTKVTFTVSCDSSSIDGRIAFMSDRDNHQREVYTIKPDGTDLQRVTDYPAFVPFWSPEGSRIAFSSTRDGNLEIYTAKPDGSDLQRVTKNNARDGGKSWSRDGSRIAFQTTRDGNYEIYTIKPDGSDPKRVTNHSSDDTLPVWSPDGSEIAFTSQRDGSNQIYRINPDGSNLRKVTDISKGGKAPRWSPDGSRIAFTSSHDGRNQIYTIRPDGTDLQQVTNRSEGCRTPSWSPDGSRIAFTSKRDSLSLDEIFMIKPDGTELRRITDNKLEDDLIPAWGRSVN